MLRFKAFSIIQLAWMLVLTPLYPAAGETVSVASYNLERYGVVETGAAPKTAESKRQVHATLKTLAAHVLALQEVGGQEGLTLLIAELQRVGLSYPHSHLVAGRDTNVNVAVLSQFPIVAVRSHTNASFLLNGRRMHVQRGFAEVDIQVNADFQFTLMAAHLKSKLASPFANEGDIREQEAQVLREIIDARLAENPKARIVVAGDFNDTKDSPSVRTIIGRGKKGLMDTRPCEPNGDDMSRRNGRIPRAIAWTHYYAKEDTYSRIDYILLSPAMASYWNRRESRILALPNWGLASDHRPIIVSFDMDRP